MSRIFVACQLPEEVNDLFRNSFRSSFNERGRTLSADELVDGCAGADGVVVTATDRLNTDVIDRLPPEIKVIATYSVGHEHIDLDAARRRRLAVLFTPDVLSGACADVAILLMLGAARRVVESIDLVRSGRWTGWNALQLIGREVYGQRLGILGMGRIGREVAKRARGFDMHVHYHNRRRLDPAVEAGATYHADLDDLMAVSNFLCIACPAGPGTRNLIDADRLGKLPRSSIVTNISRGDVVDDAALVAALESGQVGAAGLDVFANEPDIHPAYRTLPNIFAVPHIGSATIETRIAMGALAVRGLEAFFAGRVVESRLA